MSKDQLVAVKWQTRDNGIHRLGLSGLQCKLPGGLGAATRRPHLGDAPGRRDRWGQRGRTARTAAPPVRHVRRATGCFSAARCCAALPRTCLPPEVSRVPPSPVPSPTRLARWEGPARRPQLHGHHLSRHWQPAGGLRHPTDCAVLCLVLGRLRSATKHPILNFHSSPSSSTSRLTSTYASADSSLSFGLPSTRVWDACLCSHTWSIEPSVASLVAWCLASLELKLQLDASCPTQPRTSWDQLRLHAIYICSFLSASSLLDTSSPCRIELVCLLHSISALVSCLPAYLPASGVHLQLSRRQHQLAIC